MPVRILNMSSESWCPSKYQNSLRSDHPLVSYKYLIFSNFSSPFSPPDGRIWENDFIKSNCAAPWHAYQSSSFYHVQKHQTRQITVPLPPTPPKRVNPVRFCQSLIKDICIFYPPSFIPIPPLQAFSKISPSNSPPPQCQKIWSGFEIRALRHEFLRNIKFH